MINPDNDFERSFVSQVKGEQPVGGVVPVQAEAKPPINKRWFVIIGLGVILIITFIILDIIVGKDTTSQSVVIGAWGCDNGTEMRYSDDGTYIWKSSIESLVVESGTFETHDVELTTTRTARYINDSLENSNTVIASFRLTVYDESSIAFMDKITEENYICMRISND
ncbi:MAG: hypothetical protein ACK5MU_03015 [Candidatus Saccharimonadales bacterium]